MLFRSVINARVEENVVQQVIRKQRLFQLLRETPEAAPVIWYGAAPVRNDEAQLREILEQIRGQALHVIYEAAKSAGADASGDKLVEAMRGMKWVSPRGPVTIDPATRDPVQTVYIRRVEMVDGKPWSIEFDKVENVKDPGV